MKRTMSIFTVGLLLALSSFSAFSHVTPSSSMALNVGENSVEIDIRLPVDQLVIAAPQVFKSSESPFEGVDQKQLAEYLFDHVSINVPQASFNEPKLGLAIIQNIDTTPFVVTEMSFKWKEQYQPESFELHSNAILHSVLSHKTYVSVHSDIYNGFLAKDAKPLGVLKYKHESIEVPRHIGNRWTAFVSMFANGAHHIAEGTDHLMFLLCLLLPAPLISRAGKWDRPAALIESTKSVVKIVSAFTVGHSVTLALTVVGIVNVLPQLVEVAIALSVLFASVHSVKPLFEKYTVLIAIGFGLVHGMAFAEEMQGLGLSLDALLIAIFGFNLGIEAVQLAFVLFLMPCLLALAHRSFYRHIRVMLAVYTAFCASGWLLQRVGFMNNPLEIPIKWMMEHIFILYGILAFASLVSISVSIFYQSRSIHKEEAR